MPEFIADTSGEVASRQAPDDYRSIIWTDLPAFTQGYIEALLFTNVSCIPKAEFDTPEAQHRIVEGQADGSLPSDTCFGDFDSATLASIILDCRDFSADNAARLAAAYALEPGAEGYQYGRDPIDERRAGQLFWYARNGHGITFTDDGDAPCLRELQIAARAWTGADPYIGDDGKVYLS